MAKRCFAVFLFAYVALTLPVIALLGWSEQMRNSFGFFLSHYRAHVADVDAVFVGDSITAGGGNWSFQISSDPFSSINLGASGQTVFQIKSQVSKALQYQPDVVCVMGGTNDVHHPKYDLSFSCSQYRKILETIRSQGAGCIVTLAPFQVTTKKQKEIRALSACVRELAEASGCKVIDLNQELAPNGVLLEKYTVDGTHFTDAAYDVWASRIKDALGR